MKINKSVGIMSGFINGIYGSLLIYCFEIVWLSVGLSQSVESPVGEFLTELNRLFQGHSL